MTKLKGVKKNSGELYKYNSACIQLNHVQKQIKDQVQKILSDFNYTDTHYVFFGDNGIHISFVMEESRISTQLLMILDDYFGVCGELEVDSSLLVYYDLQSFPTTQSVFDM